MCSSYVGCMETGPGPHMFERGTYCMPDVLVVNPVILDRPEPDHRFHLCHMPHVL